MSKYVETRSKHALAVDRGKQAKVRYKKFGDKYIADPSSSDVEGYDTRVIPPPPESEKKEKPKKAVMKGEDYIPSPEERKKLIQHLKKNRTKEDVKKDLLITHRVIKRKEDVKLWKQNPAYYDIRGVDTQPKKLITNRIETARKFVGVDVFAPTTLLKQINTGGISIMRHPTKSEKSSFSMTQQALHRQMPKDSLGVFKRVGSENLIQLSGKLKDSNKDYGWKRVLAHEIGHALDFKTKTPKMGYAITNNNFHSARNPRIERQISKVISRRVAPYQEGKNPRYDQYRESRREQYADWFSGFITQKNVVKSKSRGYYNIFKKQNKGLIKQLKKSDAITVNEFLNKFK